MTTAETTHEQEAYESGSAKPLTAEELIKGQLVGREGIVYFEPDTTLERSRMPISPVVMGHEHPITISGLKPIAEVRFGDVSGRGLDSASVSIWDDVQGRIFASVEGTDVHEELLPASSEYTGLLVGRDVPGQEVLDESVSREHFVLGLSPDGKKIVVQNLKPTNQTFVKGFGVVPRTKTS